MLWPNVETYKDGDSLDAATLNDPINQLIARTEYLKQVLDASASRTNVAIATATLSADGGAVPKLGQPVYRVPGGNAYAQAKATVGAVDESKWFWADQQAMAVGVVGSTPSGTSATVVLSGYISFGSGLDVASVIVDKNPTSGRYFLSSTPGKLTAAPTGPIIYVCDCEIANVKVGNAYELRVVSMLVSPQYRDTGESHVHRSFVLSGKPLGGYSAKGNYGGVQRFRVPGLVPDGYAKNPSTFPAPSVVMGIFGAWTGDADVTYTVQLVQRRNLATTPSTTWADYNLEWTSDSDGSGVVEITEASDGILPPGPSATSTRRTGMLAVGTHGLQVQLTCWSGAGPGSFTWTLDMPDCGRAWMEYTPSGWYGYRLNLGMYPEMARFVPPLPANGAALIVGGLELRSAEFGESRKQWEILAATSYGGPWLIWYGGSVEGDGTSPTAPFEWDAVLANQKARDIVLHVNRMRVGPTGFVTSLQSAPGSPLKVTSAQTGANAVQGALQVGLDIDFKSESGNAEGHEVVKKIVGSTFVTGPVVERVVAGPGMAVDRQQGVVTVSASNAVYAGDFETIALRNAKQDLAGGVFPYTKLLGWTAGGPNVNSGFTAKFRVPDYIPYNAGKGYYVVVSASVFGEKASSAANAAFTLESYVLADRACTPEASGDLFDTSADVSPATYAPTVVVPFKDGYSAFDPVLVHGFGTAAGNGPGSLVLTDVDNQRVHDPALWLSTAAGAHMVVYPGYFVGISIARCGTSGTLYTAPIGFLSLRWNLVAVQ